MEPGPPTPQGAPSQDGLPIPPVDQPAQMDFGKAFDPMRALGNGVTALRRAPGPMIVAGLLMMIFDGGGGGSSGGGGNNNNYDYDNHRDDTYEQSNPYDDDPYTDLIDHVGAPVHSAVTNAFGDIFEPAEIYLQLGGPEVVAILAIVAVTVICLVILGLVFWVISSFLVTGVIRLHSHVLQTADPQNFKIIFSGGDRFKDMLLYRLLAGLVMYGVAFLTVTPGAVVMGFGIVQENPWMALGGGLAVLLIGLPVMFYVVLGLTMGRHAVVLENRGAVEALKRTWSLSRGNRFRIFFYQLVTGLAFLAVLFVGLAMCCIGVIITAPVGRSVYDFGVTESFLLLTRGEGVTGYWELWRLKHSGQIP